MIPLFFKTVTGMRPMPLLSRLPSLPAGQHRMVTDVGMRCAAKCPSLCVQSWMLISISSITCSNTDLSLSRAFSLVAFFLALCFNCPSANRVKLFGVCAASGNGGSLVMLAKTFQLQPAKPCWSSGGGVKGQGVGPKM